MSYINQKYISLFAANWSESIRTAKLLKSSHVRLAAFFPIKGQTLEMTDDDFLDKLDAFRVRFADLQDSIGNKLFRNLLKLEDESFISMIDILNAIEKRAIVSSTQEWREVREIRNAFSHDYPETLQEKAEALNLAYNSTPVLFTTLHKISTYTQRYNLALEMPKNE